MMIKLKPSLLIIILSLLFYSCEKEYSLEGNVVGSTAVFTFTGSPGSCTNAVVSGTYQAGAALGATNVVTISVDVATAGTYAVATATVNGISFTGSGIFATTGPQTISLTGTGIPTAPGTFSFTPGTNGCAFPITISSGGSSGGTAVYTLNGAPGNCTSFLPGGTYTSGTALGTDNFASVSVNVTTVGTYVITTNTVNGIAFSASGTFATTGNKVVQLSGSGTPLVAGTFDYTPGTNGCTFLITVVAGANPTNFLICTIDGVARTFNEDLSGQRIAIDTFGIIGFETLANTSPLFFITLTKPPAIATGTYNRFSVTSPSTTFCVGAYGDDSSPTSWVSGFLLQTGGFTVIVTSYTANRIEGTFSGTLYDNDGQGTVGKVITLGSFSIPY